MSELAELWQRLDLPAGPGDDRSPLRFETTTVPGFPGYRLGKSSLGTAALLVEAAPEHGSPPPPIRLQALNVIHGAACLVSIGGRAEQRTFSVAVLSPEARTLQEYFLDLVPLVAQSLGQNPTASAVADAFRSLVALFRAAGRPLRSTVQGLWSELFVLAQASDPAVLVDSWHVDANDRYDFHSGAQRIEIKSAAGMRKHRFSLEQVSPPPDADVIVVSVLTAPVATGLTIKSMLETLVTRLVGYPSLQMKAHEAVASTLGDSLHHALNESFDVELARATLRYYDVRDLPKLPGPIPPEIGQIRFAMDLSACAPKTDVDVRARGGLFAAVVSGAIAQSRR